MGRRKSIRKGRRNNYAMLAPNSMQISLQTLLVVANVDGNFRHQLLGGCIGRFKKNRSISCVASGP